MELEEGFSKMGLELLIGAMDFRRLINSAEKLINKKMESYKSLIALEEENQKLKAICDDN